MSAGDVTPQNAATREHRRSARPGSRVAILVLLDACRPDYLGRTDFLRDLAGRAGVGAMEEPFGFLPRAAYFGGLTPNDVGYTNIFAREPWRSPFPCIPARARVAEVAGARRLHQRVVAAASARLPDFGARYADGFGVDPHALSSYAITEVDPPWGPSCAYRSLFHVLDEAGIPWVQRSWPYTRDVASADPGIVGAFLDDLEDEVRFGFLHLSALDAVGHASGPGSAALQAALDEIDRACALVYSEAHRRFDRVQLLFFGDHGMVTVVRTTDLRAELQSAGFSPGCGVEMFLDSPMARFWFDTAEAGARVRAWLATRDDGTVLGAHDLTRYDADRLHRGNGDLYFVAHPGVVFAPNAFQAAGAVVHGMHGYLPDVPDNRGLMLLYDSADRTAGSVGVARATQIFPTCLQMCGLDPAAFTAVPPLAITPAGSTWTRRGVAAHEGRVARDLRLATSILATRAPASAVILAGSFGRGEGGVVDGPDGPHVLNDYDFVVAGPDAAAAAGLGPALATTLGTDFCDVLPTTSLSTACASQLYFDVRYGARVIGGDRRALDRMPRYAPADLPPDDGARLLMNRMAGVLLVPLPEQRGEQPLTQFAVNQLSKAWTAVGDAYLLGAGDYSVRLVDRAARLGALAPALGLAADTCARILRAYAYKIDPVPAPACFTAEDFRCVRAAVREALVQLEAQTGTRGATIDRESRAWEAAVTASLPRDIDAKADDAWVEARLRAHGFAPRDTAGLRGTVLRSVATWFRASTSTCDAQLWSAVRRGLTALGLPPGESVLDDPALEDARRHLAGAWMASCHG